MGLFPRGATPEGIEDRGGNVWDWTGSEYTKALEAEALTAVRDEEASAPPIVALAGGYCWGEAFRCRAAYRGDCGPDNIIGNSRGFRLRRWRAP